MGTGGRPLFDLNELPPIHDDSDFCLPTDIPDNPQLSPEPGTPQSALPSLVASEAQLSPDLGTIKVSDHLFREACVSAEVSVSVSSEARLGGALHHSSGSATVVQVSASKLGALPRLLSPLPGVSLQQADTAGLQPGQHPLSCFRPFSSFHPFVKQTQIKEGKPLGENQPILDVRESFCDPTTPEINVSSSVGAADVPYSEPNILQRNGENDLETEVGEVCDCKEILSTDKRMAEDGMTRHGLREPEVHDQPVRGDFSVSEDEKLDINSVAIQRPTIQGGKNELMDMDQSEGGPINKDSSDVNGIGESASADATLEVAYDDVQDCLPSHKAKEELHQMVTLSAPIDNVASEAETEGGSQPIGEGKFSTAFDKKSRSDQKDAKLGKKRSRQTVFLDAREAARQAVPFRTSAPKKNLYSLLPSRSFKDSPRTPLAPSPGEKVGETLFNRSIPLTKDQRQPIHTSEVSSGASTLELRKLGSVSSGFPDGSKQNRIPVKRTLDNMVEGPIPTSARFNSWKQGNLDDKQMQAQFTNPMGRKQAQLIQGKGTIDERHLKFPQTLLPKKNIRKHTTLGNGYLLQDSSIERLHREATCDKLWRTPGDAELQRVPGSFESVQEYVHVFEPLLFEECRAQLHNNWEELSDTVTKDVHVAVTIKNIEKRERGWYDVVLIPIDHKSRLVFKEGDAAVVSTPKPGSAGSSRRRSIVTGNNDTLDTEVSSRTAGIVRRYFPVDTRDPHGAILHFHMVESNTDPTTDDHAFKKFQNKGVTWYLTVLGSLATIQREYVALHAFQDLHFQMIKAILQPKPDLFPRYEEKPPAMPDCFTQSFTEHLDKTFNSPQLAAIHWAAMHTAAGTSSSNGAGKRQELWPFTLVQGPPGTGKTHTVWGMLNVIHLVQYQRYYAALLNKLAPDSLRSTDETANQAILSSSEGIGSIDEVLQRMDQSLARVLPKLCPKPRMLVCAPSNAATDELLTRVLDRGFIDGEMKIYRPDVARVGIDAQSIAAQAVSVERRSDQLLGMGREDVLGWLQQLRSRETVLAQQIAFLQKELSATAVSSWSQGAVGVDPEVLAARDQSRDARLQHLAAVVEERDKVLVEMSRLLIVESRFRPGSGFTPEEARVKLEASFANEAEIVFTTVSSSGRRLFSNLAHGFDMVVIDEAAQASEVAVLPPLSLGAARCVLVGDPQQLPATVISRAADTLQYSRSLFERFQQAGCPTLLLSVQYRMHPQIRDFPSRYFYQNLLVDSDSVRDLADEVYHRDHVLRPYLFYDISHGRESHKGGSVSYQNILEAQFAAKLYEYLQNVLKSAGVPKVSVGVITPYKLQLKCLQQEFKAVLGSDTESKGVYINTVDAFQGQERDVILMSCVRASSHGVGFVADIRRMNVALTRARRSFWVMGNAAALVQSEDWAALIADAKERGCFVSMADSAARGLILSKSTAFVPSSQGSSLGLLRIPRNPAPVKGGDQVQQSELITLQGNGGGNMSSNAKSDERSPGQMTDSGTEEMGKNGHIRNSWHVRHGRGSGDRSLLNSGQGSIDPERNSWKGIRRNEGF